MIVAVIGAAVAVIAAIVVLGWKLLDAVNSQVGVVVEQTAVIKAIEAQRQRDEEKRHSFEGLRERAEKLEHFIERLRELPNLQTGRLAVAMAEAEVLNEILADLHDGMTVAGANMVRFKKVQSGGDARQSLINTAQGEVDSFLTLIGKFTQLHSEALARVEELRSDPTA
jgi:hypothetical protein